MHKIEWNELWPKVVECYFKKLLLDNSSKIESSS